MRTSSERKKNMIKFSSMIVEDDFVQGAMMCMEFISEIVK